MNTFSKFLCLLLSFTVLFVPACKKAVENALDDIDGDQAVKVKVDGDQYESFTSNTDYRPSNGANTYASLTIASAALQGTNAADGVYLWFYIPDNMTLEESNYSYSDKDCELLTDICGFLGYGQSINDLGGVSYEQGGQATINVSELELKDGGKFKGTFSGTLIDEDSGTTFEFKDGEFDVEIDF